MELLDYLQKRSLKKIHLIWNENHRCYLSFRETPQKMVLRLHRLFENQPLAIWEALSLYIFQKDKKARALLRKIAHEYFSSVYKPSRALPSLGDVHDLSFLYEKVKRDYALSLDSNIRIGWSLKKRRFLPKKCMTLGCYDAHHREIRIHPSLDHPLVPSYFLEFVIYHEMLHITCPPKISPSGRIYTHFKEFRALERQFIDYSKAKAFEKRFFLSIL